MTDDEFDELKARLERRITEDLDGAVIGREVQPTARTIAIVAEQFLRRGILVTRGRYVDGTIVFDVVEPRGEG